MFVGLSQFSMICCSVTHSTPGNMVNTESIALDALSLDCAMWVWVGLNILNGLGSVNILSAHFLPVVEPAGVPALLFWQV